MLEESKHNDESESQLHIDDSKSNLSMNIPKLLQDDKFEPQVVEGEEVLHEGYVTQKFNESINLIDTSLHC